MQHLYTEFYRVDSSPVLISDDEESALAVDLLLVPIVFSFSVTLDCSVKFDPASSAPIIWLPLELDVACLVKKVI